MVSKMEVNEKMLEEFGVKQTSLEESKEPEKSKGRKPDFVNREEGVAVWVNTDKNGKKYLTIQLPLGLKRVNAFQIE